MQNQRNQRFQNQVVVIVGATGGLGAMFARAFAAEGARLVLVGRDAAGLTARAAELNAHPFRADITAPEQLAAMRTFVHATFGRVDVVINATGVDVRKPLAAHTPDEIQRSVAVNLTGAILLTQTFLPLMQDTGMIVHIGGFADGRLAFPYYSADVATRAGVFSFVEAVNRELKLEGSPVSVAYFSPSASDTPAEQPFHPVWKEMGLAITPKEQIAAALLDAVARRKRIGIMGGWGTVVFAKLNAVAPKVADVLVLNRYGKVLKQFLASGNGTPPRSGDAGSARGIGMGLIVLSFVFYGLLLFVLPFMPLATQVKVAASPVLVGLGEASFWIGGALVGKEVVARYKPYLNPCTWWACWRGL